MRLGCTTRPLQHLKLAKACELIATLGFTEIGLFSANTSSGAAPILSATSSAKQICAVRNTCKAAGLNPSLLLAGEWPAHLSLKQCIAQYQQLIANAHTLGASMLLDFACESKAQLPKYIALLQALEPDLQAADITLSIKPHGGISSEPSQILSLIEILDSKCFRLSFDPGNFLYYSNGKIRPEEHIAQLAPYCANFIIKDYAVTPSGPSIAINPGEGEVNFAALFYNLNQLQFSGPVFLECVAETAPDIVGRNIELTLQRMRQWVAPH
ncbi:sugar phosphate isomerase/epimerase [Chitinibacter fontanus]|uniref:Sugar phosphate isomerase/epimerase n=1 Tax=Chitinibacter fontanus TaxID=1737446 RepID=A0A7D5V7H5_9NEIS|nr:TIM barrel protein [Chitinibacter fontanus]QLI80191.1 sugar phosphate isomerase/epimerase [Chitinibacter fontanus]